MCGDWYDLIDLPGGRVVLDVGDVVGHGLEAAAVMGMLRSVLSAAIRALERPAHALEVLGLYARSIEGALNTTAVKAMVDPDSRLIIYSNAGHPPPVLVHADGECELLDQAIDPPLGARPQHVPASQAGHSYTPGDTLVLYTDGLIERRGEDIDAGLRPPRRDVGAPLAPTARNCWPTRCCTDLGVANGGRGRHRLDRRPALTADRLAHRFSGLQATCRQYECAMSRRWIGSAHCGRSCVALRQS